MKRKLSILKPDVQNAVIESLFMEKISYLNVPSELDIKKLRSDVKMGAIQFAELDKLLMKENEPQYILISTNNLEQGYLAVSYLAAGFNRKHDVDMSICQDEYLDGTQTKMTEWQESPIRIPVIKENELSQFSFNGSNNDIFAMNDTFMQGNQKRGFHTPYWMNCTNDSVCIVSEEYSFGFGNGFCVPFGDKSFVELGLNHFKGNDKIYILHVDRMAKDCGNYSGEDDREDGDDDENYMIDSSRAKWNHLVLSFSADEVSVSLTKETEKKYYKLLFQGNFSARGISVKKGLSYERLVNIITAMEEVNKCQLIENIVKYAVKDWKCTKERPIENKDFDFIDRFCRADRANLSEKRKKQRTSKERMMQELIGLEDVKRQVLNVVNVMKYNQIREKMGILGGCYHNVHVMLGAPGTAKTTVAQLMGQMMVEEHLLPDNRFTCVNGAELKGMYVGHSAPKTKALFEDNDIIVIDEAYSLVSDGRENDSFSKEVLAQLIIELENHSTDKLIIFAGYGGKKVNEKNNKMKAFLDANPGIKSRITSTIYFDSYSPDEMVRIFFKIAENNHYHLEERVGDIVRSYFQRRVLDDNFGNGREARSLLETAVIYTAERVLAQNKKAYTRAEMQTIVYEDVEKAIAQSEYADSVQNGCRISRALGFTAS